MNPQSETCDSTELAEDNPQSESARGRPRTLDEIKRREVCALISAGCGVEGAARYVGCAATTIRREAHRNPKFNDDLRRAHLAAELSPLNAMRQAAAKHWRAAAWLLERTNPQRFAKQNVRTITPEQFKKYTDILVEIFTQEAGDPDTRERVTRRLQALADQAEQEVWAAHSEIFPAPRHKSRPTDPPTSAFAARDDQNHRFDEPIDPEEPIDAPPAT